MFGEKRSDTFVTANSLESDDNTVYEYQKWSHINISDFRSHSCWHTFSYCWLWFLTIISIAVYVADTYTCIILIAFNRWPGQIEPVIRFDISRWIFAGCILFSFLLLGYQWVRAWTVIRRGSIAKDYLDPFAAQFQSLRSWRRFLVFAKLTESKKGADYIALFSYFALKGAPTVVLAQGPRQAINAITLWAVMKSTMGGGNPADSNVDNFIQNVKVLAQTQHEYATILFTMLFTLIIWLFSLLSLIAACLAYVCFLWHYVGANLTRYCKKKIEKRLRKIVATAMEKEIQRQERLREKAMYQRPSLWNRSKSSTDSLPRRPTLPNLGDDNSDAVSISTTVTRNTSNASTSTASLPQQPCSARLGNASAQKLARQPTLPCINEAEYEHSRCHSSDSLSSHGSNSDDRPLLERGMTPASVPTTSSGYRTQSSETLPSMQPAPLSIRRKPAPGGPTGRLYPQQPSYAAMRGGAGAKTFDAMGLR